jgi:hypothetical protein
MGLFTNLLACLRETKEEREFNAQLRRDGLKIAIEQLLKEIKHNIPSKEIAIKFVLQELDFAEKEQIFPPEFILNSGFHPLEYKEALDRFKNDDPQLFKVQTLLDNFLRKIKDEEELVQISMEVIEQIMYEWGIGKYSPAREEIKEEIQEEFIQPDPKRQPLEPEPIIEKIKEPITTQYDAKKVNDLMEEYSDIIGDIITGNINPKEEKRMEIFKEHITLASLEGESDHAIVLSCFYEHREPYNKELPIPVNKMSNISLKFLRSILKGFEQQGFSQAFLEYEKKNRQEIYSLIQ